MGDDIYKIYYYFFFIFRKTLRENLELRSSFLLKIEGKSIRSS